MIVRTSLPPTGARPDNLHGRQSQPAPSCRKPRQSFDLVLAFTVLGVTLISAVMLVGGLAYPLPPAIGTIVWIIPLLALALVAFAMFGRKHQNSAVNKATGKIGSGAAIK